MPDIFRQISFLQRGQEQRIQNNSICCVKPSSDRLICRRNFPANNSKLMKKSEWMELTSDLVILVNLTWSSFIVLLFFCQEIWFYNWEFLWTKQIVPLCMINNSCISNNFNNHILSRNVLVKWKLRPNEVLFQKSSASTLCQRNLSNIWLRQLVNLIFSFSVSQCFFLVRTIINSHWIYYCGILSRNNQY